MVVGCLPRDGAISLGYIGTRKSKTTVDYRSLLLVNKASPSETSPALRLVRVVVDDNSK